MTDYPPGFFLVGALAVIVPPAFVFFWWWGAIGAMVAVIVSFAIMLMCINGISGKQPTIVVDPNDPKYAHVEGIGEVPIINMHERYDGPCVVRGIGYPVNASTGNKSTPKQTLQEILRFYPYGH